MIENTFTVNFKNFAHVLGHALRCQECTGEDNRCQGTSDNGESVECPDWATSCVFAVSGEEVFRACSLIAEGCSNMDGVIIIIMIFIIDTNH